MKINQLKGGAVLSYVSIAITNVIGIFITPFIIRSLGDSAYGLYTMIGVLVGYLTLLDFGLNKSIIRFIAKYRAKNDKKGEENFIAHILIIHVFITLLILTFGFFIYQNFEKIYENSLLPEQIKDAKVMLLVLIVNLVITLPGGAFSALCFGYEEFILPKLARIIKYILRSASVVALLALGGNAIGIVLVDTIFNALLVTTTAVIVYKKLNIKIRLHYFDKSLFRHVFSFSSWLFLFSVISQFRWQFGQLILGYFFSTTVVAIYAVGITLGNYYGGFSNAIAGVFLPRAMQMTVNANSIEEITAMFIKISRIILFILLYIFGGFIICGQDFIYFWVGPQYYESYKYSIIVMIGLTPILSQGFANNLLESRGLMKFRGLVLLSLTILSICIGIYTLDEVGVDGFLWIITGALLIERIILGYYYQVKNIVLIKRYYAKVKNIYLSFVIIIVSYFSVAHLLPDENFSFLIIKATVFSCLYVLAAIQIMNKEEKDLFNTVFSKFSFRLKKLGSS